MSKLSICTISAAVCLFANTAFASTPLINWSLNDAPSTGVSELRFPMAFSKTPDASGLYFAYYTTLIGGSRPYTGFQPKPARVSGEHTFQSIFSSFSAEATTDDSNCSYGADGGDGVSCSTQFEAELGHFYSNRLTVTIKDDDLYYYSGDVYDDSTDEKIAHIGSFTIPLDAGAGLFKVKDGGFIEAYLTGGCSQNASATYGQVTGYLDGQEYSGSAVTGSVPETGNCVNAVFSTSTSITNATDVAITVTTDGIQTDTNAALINKYHADLADDNECLIAYDDNDDVDMGACSGKDETLWRMYKMDNGYYLIKNKYKNDEDNENRCLRVFASGNSVEMGSCAGQGTDYYSMRYWSVVDSGTTGYILLKNKFKGDAGNDNRCLRVSSSDSTAVEMGTCDLDSDDNSMRYWKQGE